MTVRASLESLHAVGDLDLVTTEQVEQLSVVWYDNPTR
jgi:hypothetical protein